MSRRIRGGQVPCLKQGSPRLGLRRAPSSRAAFLGFTLVEMLVAMAITLVMMGAVVTLFANISNSVRNRRATTEMSAQLRHVRNVLQQDLQGATCPGVTWQRAESNHGYIEIIEGPYREGNATNLIDLNPSDSSTNPSPTNPEIDHKVSTLPSGDTKLFKDQSWATDGSALGDADDILMLTVRNEREPFNGRAPTNVRLNKTDAEKFSVTSSNTWGYETIESPLAEVVWFAVENPGHTDVALADDPTANHFFGEPGYRTIYRRTLLIAPWLNPYRYTDPSTGQVFDTFQYDGGSFKAQPGLLRVLPKKIYLRDALAAVVAFQDRYDLSVRLEWDGDVQRWKIMANTLGDLTKRENRYGHFGFRPGTPPDADTRVYPFPLVSMGIGITPTPKTQVSFVCDPEVTAPGTPAQVTGHVADVGLLPGLVVAYEVDPVSYTDLSRRYPVRPFAFIGGLYPQTSQVILNDQGQVVRAAYGPVPLWGERRGQDVMMTDALAFDLRVYDPGAPIFATVAKAATATTPIQLDVVLTPTDPGWVDAYMSNDNMRLDRSGSIGANNGQTNVTYAYVGQGAYVDLGYGYSNRFNPPGLPAPVYANSFSSATPSWFFVPQALHDVYAPERPNGKADLSIQAPGWAVYDTWSFHYENNGINEDETWFTGTAMANAATFPTPSAPVPNAGWRSTVDQGTDGLDNNRYLGIDDVNERETTPPYDKPLRGMQVLIRAYERDSRAIRQVKINQHFMAE